MQTLTGSFCMSDASVKMGYACYCRNLWNL